MRCLDIALLVFETKLLERADLLEKIGKVGLGKYLSRAGA
mgnify:CR=1 FL=1